MHSGADRAHARRQFVEVIVDAVPMKAFLLFRRWLLHRELWFHVMLWARDVAANSFNQGRKNIPSPSTIS